MVASTSWCLRTSCTSIATFSPRQVDRRDRDAQAVKEYEAALVEVSEEMERRVLDASHAFRERHELVGDAISSLQKELDDDHRLVTEDMSYVEVRDEFPHQSRARALQSWARGIKVCSPTIG